METAQIPFFVHEADMTRLERTNKRMWILVLLLVIALVGSNVGWILYESQFTDEVYSYELTQDAADGGTNTFTENSVRLVGGDYNGEADP